MPDKPLRLLLVEDDDGDAQLVQLNLASTAAGQYQIDRAESKADAKLILSKQSFDVILCDLSLPDSDGIGTFGAVQELAPRTPIVIFSSLADEKLALAAMHQGAQDYLIKGQESKNELAKSLRFAMERHRNQASTSPGHGKPQIWACIGAKGGVGTSTVALNLAAARAGSKRVVLVESRSDFGTLSLQLAQRPTENLSHFLKSDANADPAPYLFEFPSKLSVLFGPQRPSEYCEISPAQAQRQVNQLSSIADIVVFDLPSRVCPASEVILRAATRVVLVVEREASSVRCARAMLELLKSWNLQEGRIGIVLVARTPDGLMKVDDIHKELGCGIAATVPPAVDALRISGASGSPLVLRDPKHVTSIALNAAAEILDSPNALLNVG